MGERMLHPLILADLPPEYHAVLAWPAAGEEGGTSARIGVTGIAKVY